MGCTDKNQSAIKEVRDQLFIDTADSKRLNVVTDNLGWFRPIFGFGNDDEWRAFSKYLALGPKQIEWAFRKVLEICLGPEYARSGVLAEDADIGDKYLILEDASDLIQVGTIIVDAGTVNEEIVDYCFVDRATNKVFLKSALTFSHTALAPADALLFSKVEATDTSITLTDTLDFPTSGYPYTIIVGKGTINEETVTVSNNDTVTNTLTISALVNDHEGMRSGYLRKPLYVPATAGRTFIQFDIQDTDEFPEEGWIRIDGNTATIISGNTETYVLSDGQTLTVSVNGGAPQVVTFNTADFVAIGAATALEVAAVITEDLIGAAAADIGGQVVITAESLGNATTLQVTGGTANGALGFSTSLITGTDEIVFYDENDVSEYILFLKTPLKYDHASGASVELLKDGVNVSTASVVQEGIGWSIYDTSPKEVKIRVPEAIDEMRLQDASFLHDPVPIVLGSTTLAVATVATDTIIELASAADFPDEAGMLTIDGTLRRFYTFRDEDAIPNPTLTLTEPIGAVYAIGTTVVLYEVPYASTQLEEGNIRNIGGAVQEDQYSGPYCFEPGEYSPKVTSTTLTALLPPATEVALDTLVNRETLEAKDLSLWPNTGQVRVGSGTGFIEDLDYSDITLAVDTIGAVVDSGGVIGTSQVVVDTSGVVGEAFPETVLSNTANYRIAMGAMVVSANAETYALTDGWTLTVSVDGGVAATATFNIADFGDITMATAAEIAVVINTDIAGATAVDVGGFVAIYSDTGDSIQVTGGTANPTIGFSTTVITEEIVTVYDEALVMGLQTFNIKETFSKTYPSGVPVRMYNDVITVDATVRTHFAEKVNPTTLGHSLDYLVNTISLATTVGFDQTSGYVFLNFGNGRHNAETRLVSVVMPAIYEFEDTSQFPTTDFPYQVILSPGRVEEEVVNVIANDTGTNRLTFSTAPLYTHTTGPAPFTSYVVFKTGDMELVEYQDVDGNDLILNPPQVLNKHTIGESVVDSGDASIPRTDGFSYPFYLPPNNFICLEEMFERVRAAGIQVTILTF